LHGRTCAMRTMKFLANRTNRLLTVGFSIPSLTMMNINAEESEIGLV
jgi:hypothetical protein